MYHILQFQDTIYCVMATKLGQSFVERQNTLTANVHINCKVHPNFQSITKAKLSLVEQKNIFQKK